MKATVQIDYETIDCELGAIEASEIWEVDQSMLPVLEDCLSRITSDSDE